MRWRLCGALGSVVIGVASANISSTAFSTAGINPGEVFEGSMAMGFLGFLLTVIVTVDAYAAVRLRR
ncbi:hypothetical protein AS189_11620 [Arthrobacter alpinus]|uniref:Uncharacterized protein n=1 Tax=Arthrobacter alpinus TaxID=656366 RepID=A0A0S2M0L9_9MICC|nr:hypothetical protein [Arthrobacter alpinus]ALO67024.1 hypothetical protein AS189_11620 [Arthrobacter alpinus]